MKSLTVLQPLLKQPIQQMQKTKFFAETRAIPSLLSKRLTQNLQNQAQRDFMPSQNNVEKYCSEKLLNDFSKDRNNPIGFIKKLSRIPNTIFGAAMKPLP